MNDAFFKTPARPPLFGFAGGALDRLSERREDSDYLARLRARPDAAAAIFARDMPILPAGEGPRSPFLPLAEVTRLGGARLEALLGVAADGAPVFAALLPDDAVEQVGGGADGFFDRRQLIAPGRDDLALVDLRSIAMQGLVAPGPLAILGQAKSILSWHVRHGFCANCGAATRVAAAGWRRECDVCQTQHFPRTDPVVIMLAIDGDRCLLGRQARWPTGMYSCLAGFLEPGETIEEAVQARNPRGGGDRLRRGRLSRVAALAVSLVADDRLLRPRDQPRDCRRRGRARGRALVYPRRGHGDVRQAPRRGLQRPRADGDCPPHHAGMGGGRLSRGAWRLISAPRSTTPPLICRLRRHLLPASGEKGS